MACGHVLGRGDHKRERIRVAASDEITRRNQRGVFSARGWISPSARSDQIGGR